MAIDVTDAAVEKTIFEMRAAGKSLGTISDWLCKNHVFTLTGKERWSREMLNKLVRNEKYVGDVLLQKTYGTNLPSGKLAKIEKSCRDT